MNSNQETIDRLVLGADLNSGDKDDAGIRLVASRAVTARIPHICGLCSIEEELLTKKKRRHIKPGDRYRQDTAVADGKLSTRSTCFACVLEFDVHSGVLDAADERAAMRYLEEVFGWDPVEAA